MITASLTFLRARRQGFRLGTCLRLARDARARAIDVAAGLLVGLVIGYSATAGAVGYVSTLQTQRDQAWQAKQEAEAVLVSCLNRRGAIIDDEGYLCEFVSIGKHPR